MSSRRDLALTLALFAVLIAATVIIYLRQGPPAAGAPPLSTHGSGPDGGLALYRWLGRLGYDTRQLEAQQFAVPAAARLLLVARSTAATGYTSAEIAAVQQWVASGGMLVLVAVDVTDDSLLGAFGASPVELGSVAHTATPAQPLWGDPLARALRAETGLGLRLDPDFVVEAAAPDGTPLVALRRLGAGQVYATSAPYLLENSGIGLAANRSLVASVLAGIPAGATIAFDEYHLGFAAQPPARGLGEALVSTPVGRTGLFACAILAAYLVLSGRRLGPPLPAPEAPARSMAEYLTSMAGIFRRAGLRASVAEQYRRAFLQALGDRYGLRPSDDATLVAAVAERLPAADPRAARLQTLLAAQPPGSERALLDMVRSLDALRADLDA